MPVKLDSDFIGDLVGVGDANLAGRVLRKVFDSNGRFIERGRDDHRYRGIDDGWIRYVSKGLRVIYRKDGNDVTLYRAGPHSVEDDLVAPHEVGTYVVVDNPVQRAMSVGPGVDLRGYTRVGEAVALEQQAGVGSGVAGKRLLYNHVDRFLYGNLLGRRFLPHKDVYLVSPFLTFDLLRSTDLFGQMLDELIEGGACIWLVTRPPTKLSDIVAFEELAARNINVFFNNTLHAKIFAFILDRDQLKPEQRVSRDFISIGSANLTQAGINPQGLLNNNIQYELSYEATNEDWPHVETFIFHITELSTELDVVRANLMRKASNPK